MIEMKMLNCAELFLVKNKLVVVVVLLNFVALGFGEKQISRPFYHPLSDYILAEIKGDKWREEETKCLNDITRLFEGVRNYTLWATWVFDSMQVPLGALYGSRYHLGNFDQCLDERWSSSHPELETQYCLVDVTAQEQPAREFHPYEDAEDFVQSKSIYGRRNNLNSIGICVPASCSPQSVEKISTFLIRASHIAYGNVSVDPRNCQRVTSKQTAYSFGFYVFWFIILTLTAAVATVYIVEDYITGTKISEIAAWFSPSKNFKKLMEIRAKDVKSLHGIRFWSSGTMVVIHYLYVVHLLAIINHNILEKVVDNFLGRPIAHLDILTNSFSVLSGFVFVKGHWDSENLKPFEVLFKRYQRFIALYAMVIFYIVSVSPHTGSGPLWPKYLKLEHEPCVRNWWPGLLMMFDTGDICYIPTWYISCDFQLSIIGVIILWCWKKDQRKGFVVFTAVLFASIVIPIFLTHWYRMSPYLLYDFDKSFDMSQNQVYQKVYSKTYGNTSSYLIGFATGYIMSVYKPQQNNKIFSKTTSIIISLSLGYIVISMMNAFGKLLFNENDNFIYAWYAGIDDMVWSSALCGLILICEYRTLPIVTDFLESKLFVVCSRLSYGVYLIHMALVYRNIYSLRAPLTHDIIHLIVNGVGYVLICFMLSWIQWFIIEAPATNMFSYFQKNRNRTRHNNQNGNQTLEENGKQK